MDLHKEIHCLSDIGMIAGSRRILYIDCLDTSGKTLGLSKAKKFGCRFLYYGTQDLAFDIQGTEIANTPGRMCITISSEKTNGFSDCCLEYIPYIDMDSYSIKFGKGLLFIEGDAV